MLNSLLPRPLASSGSSPTGNTSSRPSTGVPSFSIVAAATAISAFGSSGTRAAGSAFAWSGTDSTALPPRLRA